MLAVVFSDIHSHNYKKFDQDGSRLKNTLNVFDDVWKFAHKNNIQVVLFGGDLYDQQKVLPTVVVNAVVAKVKELAESYPDIVCYAVTGNHDQATKSLYGQPAVSALRHLQTVVPNNFKVIDDSGVTLGDRLILHGIPYYEYPEHFRKALADRAADTSAGWTNILMVHQTPNGIYNDFIPADTDVNDELYDSFDFVFCGHIHQHQQITDKFVVVGSPIHRDLGDAGNEKGFLVFDMEKPEEGIDFIPTTGRYPEFRKINSDDPDKSEFVDQGDYVVEIPEILSLNETEKAHVEEFSTKLKPVELVTNFWEEVDGQDEELLEIGLSFL